MAIFSWLRHLSRWDLRGAFTAPDIKSKKKHIAFFDNPAQEACVHKSKSCIFLAEDENIDELYYAQRRNPVCTTRRMLTLCSACINLYIL